MISYQLLDSTSMDALMGVTDIINIIIVIGAILYNFMLAA